MGKTYDLLEIEKKILRIKANVAVQVITKNFWQL